MSNAPIAPLLFLSIFNFIRIYLAIIVVRLLLTWFPNIDWMQQIVGFLSPVTDPYLNLFRFVPPIGAIDISPMIAIVALQIVMEALGAIAQPLMSSF
jgi:YggT family protein